MCSRWLSPMALGQALSGEALAFPVFLCASCAVGDPLTLKGRPCSVTSLHSIIRNSFTKRQNSPAFPAARGRPAWPSVLHKSVLHKSVLTCQMERQQQLSLCHVPSNQMYAGLLPWAFKNSCVFLVRVCSDFIWDGCRDYAPYLVGAQGVQQKVLNCDETEAGLTALVRCVISAVSLTKISQFWAPSC